MENMINLFKFVATVALGMIVLLVFTRRDWEMNERNGHRDITDVLRVMSKYD